MAVTARRCVVRPGATDGTKRGGRLNQVASRRSGDGGNGDGRDRQRDGGRRRTRDNGDGAGAAPDLRERPVDLAAERGVLGSIFLKPDACDDVALVLRPEDFADEAHQILFRHLLELHDGGKRIDTTIVLDRLRSKGDLERIGGVAAIGEIVQSVPHAAHATHYAQIVRDKSLLRSLIDAGTDILRDAYDSTDEPKELLSRAESKIFTILENRSSADATPINEVLGKVLERMDARMKHEQTLGGVETGFTELDALCGGLHNSELVILAARPSMGKTALALNIAEHVALSVGMPAAIFSMEMSGPQLVMRMLGSLGRLDQHKMRTGALNDDDWQKLTTSVGRLNEAPIFIDESGMLNPTELRGRARRLHRQQGGPGLGLIVIDYLQLMETGNSMENRATEVAEISRALKAVAKELNVPVVALSQLNRGLEQRPNKRPVMSDLRESGAIEQDADLILFIYRDEVYNPDSPDKGTAEIIIGKQRNGPIGTVKLTFLGQYTRFENFAAPGRY